MLKVNTHTILRFYLKLGLGILLFLLPLTIFAQSKKEQRHSTRYMQMAEEALKEGNFAKAEANYRMAVAIDTNNAKALYNMGTLYFKKHKRAEASSRLANAGSSAEVEKLKHKAYHNQGNAFMKQQNYRAAVNAYKNALRNDPTDDKTRYNLALAKKMLKQKMKKQKKKKNNENDKKKKKHKGKDQKKKKNKKKQNKKDKGKKDQGENKKDDKGNPKKDKPKKKKPDQNQKQKSAGDKKKQKQQPKPKKGGLTPRQVKNLMEAMKNQERKIQKRINAKKAKGVRRNTMKNW